VFRAERCALVPEMRNASFYTPPYSNYTLEILDAPPANCGHWVECWTKGVMRSTEALSQAVKIAGAFLGESIDPESEFFTDAKASRLMSFHRAVTEAPRDSSDSESYDSSDDEERRPPLPPDPVPFEKPPSTALCDLLYAFATHVKDATTGGIVPVPLFHDPVPRHMYQPLLFVSTAGLKCPWCGKG